jgi:hypothetical protein
LERDMSARLDITVGAMGVLSISAMPKQADDTKPIGALLTEDGPPREVSAGNPGVIPSGTKTFGTGVQETNPKGPDRAPDDSAADPDTD